MSSLYKNMSELLEERELNGWKLQKFEISDDNIRARFDGIAPGKYIRLLHNGECVMSNTDMERMTNLDFLRKCMWRYYHWWTWHWNDYYGNSR